MRHAMDLHATPEELLAIVEEMFPREFDRARAQLVIVKQRERIAELEARHGHRRPHDHE
ncbi:hypothetical protein [Streptomyces pseudogriseolus]|uniref:hypothetical protein n=1 Tax=Streptomyces pseudogriseolus TaxID=36817 RepID=UPI003FA1FFF6